MKVLVTGARGMAGSALARSLRNIRDGKDGRRPGLHITEVFEYDKGSPEGCLDALCKNADFVFNFAGVNRPGREEELMEGNCGLVGCLLDALERHKNLAPVMLASSIQASLSGRFGDSAYGRSKRAGEDILFGYAARTGAKAAVYRFPNLLGHSRPNYNSAVSTFCWAVANGKPYTVNDRSTELELLCVSDMVEGMLDLLEGKEKHCEYDGTQTVPKEDGRYCYVPKTHRVTLGEVVDLLERFKSQPLTLLMPQMPEGSFAKDLFSLYLTYLPLKGMRHALRTNADARGSFTELMRTEDCGQVSVNIAHPGVTKGNHWHVGKWEQFIVVSGHGLIRERNIVTGETVEFEVSGDKIEAVYMIPGWTHSITNLSETEDLVTVMTCNEVFNPGRPDTFFEEV